MSKAAYRAFCEGGAEISIFSQPWWLDAIAGEEGWDVATVVNGGRVVAAMPYTVRRRGMFRVSMQPPLTQNLGPWLQASGARLARSLAQEKKLMEELISQLPPFDHFQQNWHPSRKNWLPFHWKGFHQTTRYTYAIPALTDLDAVWGGFDQNIRTDIRKARERFALHVRSDLPIDAFLELHRMVFARQGRSLPYSEALVRRLYDVCMQRGCCRVLIAVDAEGRQHAGAFIVWDAQSAYYLMGGGDPELRNSGATSLCLWEAIRFAAGVTKRFDFEGSMLEPVERFFRAFGAEQVPYFQVRRSPSLVWRTMAFLRSLVREGG